MLILISVSCILTMICCVLLLLLLYTVAQQVDGKVDKPIQKYPERRKKVTGIIQRLQIKLVKQKHTQD